MTLTEVADAFSVTPNTVSRWRSGRGRNELTPPDHWRSTLADLAKRRLHRMEAQASDLKLLAAQLDAD